MSFPSWLSWYKKPSYVDLRQLAASFEKKATAGSAASTPRSSIEIQRKDVPKKLSLERILKNQTCSPMSMYDFYMYLKHIEHSPENLEFYIWFKNYEAGRLTGNPDARPKTSQTSDSDTEGENNLENNDSQEKIDGRGSESQETMNLEQADIYSQITALVDPSAGCNTKRGCQAPKAPAFTGEFTTEKDGTLSYTVKTSTDIDEARRDELELIKTLFLVPGAPKELNIPSPMRKKVLEAITTSTDASNLKPVADHCFLLLKSCSHRNFIRLGVSNGTFETVCMATGLGIVLTITGILAMLCLAFLTPSFRHCSRWRGIGIWPMWSIGVGLILSGLRGSCFFLLLFSRRQPLPWENFDDSASILTQRSKPMRFLSKLMIFDRKLRVKDDNLRGLQRKIVMQSILGGMVFATLMEVFFLALPIWAPIH